MKFGMKIFLLPGQETQAAKLMNDPNIVITTNERYFAPKEGTIYLYLGYEDYRENEEA